MACFGDDLEAWVVVKNGTPEDYSGGSHDGTGSGLFSTSDEFGRADAATSFDLNDYLEFSASTFSSSLQTLVFVFKPDNSIAYNTSARGIFGHSTGGVPMVRFGSVTGGFPYELITIYSQGYQYWKYNELTQSTISANWHFMAFVYDSTTTSFDLYYDGVWEGKGHTYLGGPTQPWAVSAALRLGSHGAYLFDGKISLFAAWSRALSKDEVELLHHQHYGQLQTYAGLLDGAVLIDPMRGLLDFSGNGNDGTNNGADATDDEEGRSEAYDFVSANSDYVDYGDVGTAKTLVLRINLDSTSENIIQDNSGSGVSCSGGTLTYTDWDNAYVDGVDTDTISTGWTTLVVTSTTDVTVDALELGRISTTYGDFKCSYLGVFTEEFSAGDALAIHQLFEQGKKPLPYNAREHQ